MAHLLTDLANYFKLDEINIDNWTFKCFYKVSYGPLEKFWRYFDNLKLKMIKDKKSSLIQHRKPQVI